jgi:hypothetical protein
MCFAPRFTHLAVEGHDALVEEGLSLGGRGAGGMDGGI